MGAMLGGSLAPIMALLACFGCSRSDHVAPFESRLFRHGEPSGELGWGASIAAGDELYLELETRRTLHVYVINEDDRGDRWILHPCVGVRSSRIEAGADHRLPPHLFDRVTFWPVRAPTARERILVVASAAPLDDLERTIAAAQRAEPCAAPATEEVQTLVDWLMTATLAREPSAPGSGPRVASINVATGPVWLAVHEVRGEPR